MDRNSEEKKHIKNITYRKRFRDNYNLLMRMLWSYKSWLNNEYG